MGFDKIEIKLEVDVIVVGWWELKSHFCAYVRLGLFGYIPNTLVVQNCNVVKVQCCNFAMLQCFKVES